MNFDDIKKITRGFATAVGATIAMAIPYNADAQTTKVPPIPDSDQPTQVDTQDHSKTAPLNLPERLFSEEESSRLCPDSHTKSSCPPLEFLVSARRNMENQHNLVWAGSTGSGTDRVDEYSFYEGPNKGVARHHTSVFVVPYGAPSTTKVKVRRDRNGGMQYTAFEFSKLLSELNQIRMGTGDLPNKAGPMSKTEIYDLLRVNLLEGEKALPMDSLYLGITKSERGKTIVLEEVPLADYDPAKHGIDIRDMWYKNTGSHQAESHRVEPAKSQGFSYDGSQRQHVRIGNEMPRPIKGASSPQVVVIFHQEDYGELTPPPEEPRECDGHRNPIVGDTTHTIRTGTKRTGTENRFPLNITDPDDDTIENAVVSSCDERIPDCDRKIQVVRTGEDSTSPGEYFLSVDASNISVGNNETINYRITITPTDRCGGEPQDVLLRVIGRDEPMSQQPPRSMGRTDISVGPAVLLAYNDLSLPEETGLFRAAGARITARHFWPNWSGHEFGLGISFAGLGSELRTPAFRSLEVQSEETDAEAYRTNIMNLDFALALALPGCYGRGNEERGIVLCAGPELVYRRWTNNTEDHTIWHYLNDEQHDKAPEQQIEDLGLGLYSSIGGRFRITPSFGLTIDFNLSIIPQIGRRIEDPRDPHPNGTQTPNITTGLNFGAYF